MTWPRDDWVEALWTSTALKPNEIFVGLAFARQAGDRQVTYAAEKQLQAATNLSRDAVRRARDGLIQSGWLVLHERARQQRAARYRMVVQLKTTGSRTPETTVSRTPETTGSRTSADPDVRETTSAAREPYVSDVREEAPKLLGTTSTTSTAVDDLWVVVLENLPQTLAVSLARSQRVEDALARHVDEGWTPDLLSSAVRGRSWSGAQGGAVVHWLTNLAGPGPVPIAGPRRCTRYGHEHALVTSAGCSACRTEALIMVPA